MIPELLWIVGIYVMAAALVNGVLKNGADPAKRHYVLVAGNHQKQIEWYIRALKRFSRRTGTDIGITVLLEPGADESGQIIRIFVRHHDWIRLIARESVDEDETANPERWREYQERLDPAGGQLIWVDLGNREDLKQLPL